jgi:hypothetical protein
MERAFYLLTCKIIAHLDQATAEESILYHKHFDTPFKSLTIRRWMWTTYELLDLCTDLDHGVIAIKSLDIISIVLFIKDQGHVINNTYPDLIEALNFFYFIRKTDRPLLEPENNDLNLLLDRYDQSEYCLHAHIIEQGARKLYEHQQTLIIQTPSKPVILPSKPIISSNTINKPIISSNTINKPIISSNTINKPINKPIISSNTINKPIISSNLGNKQITSKKLGNLDGQIIIFYGFQCSILKADIEARGGKVTKNLSGITTFLVMKDLNADTNNVRRAEEQGVRLISKDDFIAQYIN